MMTMRSTILTAALLVLAAGNAEAQGAGDAKKGQAYAEKVCAECHAVKPGDTRSPRQGATPFEIVMRVPGMTAMALNVFFQTPHPTMPNLVVEGQDREDLIAYMLSFKASTN